MGVTPLLRPGAPDVVRPSHVLLDVLLFDTHAILFLPPLSIRQRAFPMRCFERPLALLALDPLGPFDLSKDKAHVEPANAVGVRSAVKL